MTNIEKDLKEEIKKLNDRVITLESKIKKSKSKFINVISNEEIPGTSNSKKNDINNDDQNTNFKKRYDTWVQINNKKSILRDKRIIKNKNKKNENNISNHTTKNNFEFLSQSK
jgi:hypothetical protein